MGERNWRGLREGSRPCIQSESLLEEEEEEEECCNGKWERRQHQIQWPLITPWNILWCSTPPPKHPLLPKKVRTLETDCPLNSKSKHFLQQWTYRNGLNPPNQSTELNPAPGACFQLSLPEPGPGQGINYWCQRSTVLEDSCGLTNAYWLAAWKVHVAMGLRQVSRTSIWVPI